MNKGEDFALLSYHTGVAVGYLSEDDMLKNLLDNGFTKENIIEVCKFADRLHGKNFGLAKAISKKLKEHEA